MPFVSVLAKRESYEIGSTGRSRDVSKLKDVSDDLLKTIAMYLIG